MRTSRRRWAGDRLATGYGVDGAGHMDSNNIRKDQLAALCRGLHPELRYLARLRSRMEQAGFLPDDPLFRLVNQAYDSVHKLSVHAHYLSCKSGDGRAPERND
jgi:hypothetical protein